MGLTAGTSTIKLLFLFLPYSNKLEFAIVNKLHPSLIFGVHKSRVPVETPL